ncbi:hypothetical protein SAMD00023353_3200710 [Rosellinia necatrix]|uniref:Uncharacterized protein n=1 Tax=Rosellinia necatrix TaxID=77044 RepID=A0A1W2TIN1_ROSNE|nr:hypothetical protein SAMD00023353_3200710 [Rosellinia necatrix]
MSSNSQSFSYSFYSSSSSTNGGQPQRTVYAERSYTDHTGTQTERMHQLPGQRPVYEFSEQPANRRMGGAGATAAVSSRNRITDVSDVDRKYEKRMGDGYVKREGGA